MGKLPVTRERKLKTLEILLKKRSNILDGDPYSRKQFEVNLHM